MKCIRKADILEAEQYLKDAEVPVLELLFLQPPGLHLENEYAKFDSYQRGVSTLVVKDTFETEVEYGDWVVKIIWDSGEVEFYVCDDEDFHKYYEECIITDEDMDNEDMVWTKVKRNTK